MATTPVHTPPRPSNGRAKTPAQPTLLKGDDGVPRGLAVASAITLRVLIVLAGIVIVAMGAARLMLVVLPVIISILLTTLLLPLAHRLQRHRWRPAPAALASVLLALLVFFGLWALIIPGVLSQSDDLFVNVQDGAKQAVGVLEPLGIGRGDVDRAIDEGLKSVKGGAVANEVLTGAMLVTQWAAGVVLIVVLTFFFVKDGDSIWNWLVELFYEERQDTIREAGSRSWAALSAYVQGVFLVATIDAVLIGAGLLILGVPVAMPLIVLTFLAAFFPIVGAFTAGAAAVLVALVANGLPTAIAILAIIVAVQQLEGNVFYPIVVGRKLALHPVGILLALAVGGVLGGVAGAFLAMPVVAVGGAILHFMRERREARQATAVLSPP
ncbi:MAG TPA: AI-2E family transporter [Solirubrobacteraceae bacterium]|nr:AI-2E family transporter [Solirubrobacteraceae bacterium]